ncbi:hypothetical protein AYI69_g7016 [Smittium culicis]|uniref:Uncharacterized protein n=1 Tax=Smittium culicis TaxID=133412 RepID=A0A1R1XUW4_9FUNG|nr:hypothetical protein AYI69_g7016 [Smittium culicis]
MGANFLNKTAGEGSFGIHIKSEFEGPRTFSMTKPCPSLPPEPTNDDYGIFEAVNPVSENMAMEDYDFEYLRCVFGVYDGNQTDMSQRFELCTANKEEGLKTNTSKKNLLSMDTYISNIFSADNADSSSALKAQPELNATSIPGKKILPSLSSSNYQYVGNNLSFMQQLNSITQSNNHNSQENLYYDTSKLNGLNQSNFGFISNFTEVNPNSHNAGAETSSNSILINSNSLDILPKIEPDVLPSLPSQASQYLQNLLDIHQQKHQNHTSNNEFMSHENSYANLSNIPNKNISDIAPSNKKKLIPALKTKPPQPLAIRKSISFKPKPKPKHTSSLLVRRAISDKKFKSLAMKRSIGMKADADMRLNVGEFNYSGDIDNKYMHPLLPPQLPTSKKNCDILSSYNSNYNTWLTPNLQNTSGKFDFYPSSADSTKAYTNNSPYIQNFSDPASVQLQASLDTSNTRPIDNIIYNKQSTLCSNRDTNSVDFIGNSQFNSNRNSLDTNSGYGISNLGNNNPFIHSVPKSLGGTESGINSLIGLSRSTTLCNNSSTTEHISEPHSFNANNHLYSIDQLKEICGLSNNLHATPGLEKTISMPIKGIDNSSAIGLDLLNSNDRGTEGIYNNTVDCSSVFNFDMNSSPFISQNTSFPKSGGKYTQAQNNEWSDQNLDCLSNVNYFSTNLLSVDSFTNNSALNSPMDFVFDKASILNTGYGRNPQNDSQLLRNGNGEETARKTKRTSEILSDKILDSMLFSDSYFPSDETINNETKYKETNIKDVGISDNCDIYDKFIGNDFKIGN